MEELNKLEAYLKEHNYNYERRSVFGDNDQIVVFDSNGKRAWDVVFNKYSYGYASGLLEAMGKEVVRVVDDEVEGYLTAQDIIERLEENKLR